MTQVLNEYNSVSLTLQDALYSIKRELLLFLNCHHIGQIQEFDSSTMTASVSINYVQTYKDPTSETGFRNEAYPVLFEVPVILLQGSGVSLRFPIKQGDNCLLLFNDRDLGAWVHSGQVKENPTNRLHGYSDAIALVGLNNFQQDVPNYDANRAELSDGTAKVSIGKVGGVGNSQAELSTPGASVIAKQTTILMENNLFSLNQLVQELITEMENVANLTASLATASSQPAIATALAAVIVQMQATALKFSELIE